MNLCHWASSSKRFCLDCWSLEDDGNTLLLSQCCSITSQKNGILNFTTVKTSKLTEFAHHITWFIFSFLLARRIFNFIEMWLAAEGLDFKTAFYQNIACVFLNLTGKCTCHVALHFFRNRGFWSKFVKTSSLFYMLEFTVAKFYFIDILLFVTLCTRTVYCLISVKNNTELLQKFHADICHQLSNK